MTSIEPLNLFEILKQKINWGTLLTPVRKISEKFESFNTPLGQTFLLNAMDISGGDLKECKEVISEKDLFQTLSLDTTIKTIFGNLSNPCLVKEKDGTVSILVGMDVFEFEKPLNELITKTGLDKDITKNLSEAKNKLQKFAKINIGKIDLSEESKDILGLFTAFVLQEYDKSQIKDGKLQDKLFGELSVISSENNKFVEILDTTNLKNNPKLCDVSDSDTTNLLSVYTITKVRKQDENNYCVDLETNKYYQQNRVLSIITVPIDLKVKHAASTSDMMDNKKDLSENQIKELDKETKKSVLDSYVGNFISTVYKDSKKWNIEWMRLNDGAILMKVKEKDGKNIIFNKFDVTNAIMVEEKCPEYKVEPRIKEFIRVQEFCKSKDKYKLKFVLNGSDQSRFIGMKIPKSELQEMSNLEELDKFRENFGQFDKAGFKYNTYKSYGGVCASGLCGSSLYGYPYNYTYGNYYGTYYVPPVVSSIVPTAPVISTVPYVYSYPNITTNTYSLGSYYSPYTYYVPYSYGVPYTYTAPYTYSIPYTYYVLSEEISEIKRIKQHPSKHVQTFVEDEFDKFRVVKKDKNFSFYKN
jgi:hypothetical protein